MMARPSRQEEELVRRIQHGDDVAFDRLVELCAGRVYQLAFRLVGNADDAHDMAQEAFVRVYQAIPHFKGESAFSTWLYRIVVNVCYDELKRRRRRPPPVTELEQDDEPHPSLADATDGESAEDALLQQERRAAVQRAIAGLPQAYRMVIILYDIQGFSYEEVASVLRMKIGTVKSRLNRARNLLREKLAGQRELFGLGESQST